MITPRHLKILPCEPCGAPQRVDASATRCLCGLCVLLGRSFKRQETGELFSDLGSPTSDLRPQ